MGVCLDKDLQLKTADARGVDGTEVGTTKPNGDQKEDTAKSKPMTLDGKKSRKRRELKKSKTTITSEEDKKDFGENGGGGEEVIVATKNEETVESPPPPIETRSANDQTDNLDEHLSENETRERGVVDSVQVSTVDLTARSKSDTYSLTTMPILPELTKPAPEFSGPAVVDGVFKDIKLSDYKGKYLVLFFYPLDFTFVCPTEIISFSDKVDEFKAINCEVIACSTDSQYSHFAWVNTSRKQGGLGSLKIPLLADKTGKIARDYGCYKEDEGIAFRGLYIIDDKGRLRQITINDLPVGRSVDETLRLVQAFQFTDKHGEVCPANWKPGDKTMKPDPNASKEYFEQKH